MFTHRIHFAALLPALVVGTITLGQDAQQRQLLEQFIKNAPSLRENPELLESYWEEIELNSPTRSSPKRVTKRRSPTSPRSRSRKPRANRTVLPATFLKYDRDGDGQIGLYEWPMEKYADFKSLDLNADGFLTPRELAATSAK